MKMEKSSKYGETSGGQFSALWPNGRVNVTQAKLLPSRIICHPKAARPRP
jgi:hypothetical protein